MADINKAKGHKMTEECRVTRIKRKYAFVSLTAQNKCGGCKACAFGRNNKLSIPAVMSVNCKVGDKVLVEMPHKDTPVAALLVYVIPLVFLIAGFIIGGLIGDIYRVIFALIFAAAAIFPCILLERWFCKKQGYLPVVVGVIDDIPPSKTDEQAT